jgi:hypothetical protein
VFLPINLLTFRNRGEFEISLNLAIEMYFVFWLGIVLKECEADIEQRLLNGRLHNARRK